MLRVRLPLALQRTIRLNLGLKQVINSSEAGCLSAVQTADHVSDVHAKSLRSINSVVECNPDTIEVTGSNPVLTTQAAMPSLNGNWPDTNMMNLGAYSVVQMAREDEANRVCTILLR